MTSQELANVLLRHWQLLWPLPAAERMKRIDEIAKDYQFEAQLSEVAKEMSHVD